MSFHKLHLQEKPLLICNVWDVQSAKVAQRLNYKAIGTSSGAIASMLGYQDGEEISFKELAYIVERISKSVNLPLTVDLEAGYSRNPKEIAKNISTLSDLGVVGINIEDSIVTDKRRIVDDNTFSKLLKEVCHSLEGQNLFINVRTDTFLLQLPNALKETIKRAKKYEQAGAKGLFVPCIEKEQDIETLVKEIDLPLNVMCMPKLPKFNRLKELGVKRISMGNFVFEKTSKTLENELNQISQNNSFENLFN